MEAHPARLSSQSAASELQEGPKSRLKLCASAGGLLGVALLLRRLPVRPSSFALLSSDWKSWAKVFLSVAALNRLNQAIGWKPPAWLSAIESVALINPLMLAHNKKTLISSFRQVLVMAPLVAGMVQATSVLSERMEHGLEEKCHIPPLVTRLGLSLLTMGLGIKIYPGLYTRLASSGLMGKDTQARLTGATQLDQESQASALSTGIANICHRGCCASLVCMSELGEYMGALGNWFHNRTGEPSQ